VNTDLSEVCGRQKKLIVGTFRAKELNRSWTRKTELSIAKILWVNLEQQSELSCSTWCWVRHQRTTATSVAINRRVRKRRTVREKCTAFACLL